MSTKMVCSLVIAACISMLAGCSSLHRSPRPQSTPPPPVTVASQANRSPAAQFPPLTSQPVHQVAPPTARRPFGKVVLSAGDNILGARTVLQQNTLGEGVPVFNMTGGNLTFIIEGKTLTWPDEESIEGALFLPPRGSLPLPNMGKAVNVRAILHGPDGAPVKYLDGTLPFKQGWLEENRLQPWMIVESDMIAFPAITQSAATGFVKAKTP